MNGGVILTSGTSLVAAGSSASAPVRWNGGQGTLVITAQTYAATVSLMLVGVGPNSRNIKVNSGNIVADGVYPLMLPAGNYQIQSLAGSSVAIFAGLYPTP